MIIHYQQIFLMYVKGHLLLVFPFSILCHFYGDQCVTFISQDKISFLKCESQHPPVFNPTLRFLPLVFHMIYKRVAFFYKDSVMEIYRVSKPSNKNSERGLETRNRTKNKNKNKR
jgi:hypothetical protein